MCGLTCPNLSTTPLEPKSGEHDVHIPPSEDTASMVITVSTQFGTKPATIVPFLTPKLANPFCTEDTLRLSSLKVTDLAEPLSPSEITAT